MSSTGTRQAEKDWVNAAKEHETRFVYMDPYTFKVYKVIKDKRTGKILYDSRRVGNG